MAQNDTRAEKLREALRQIMDFMSPREMEAHSGVSYASIYRMVREDSDLVPQRATMRALEEFVDRVRSGQIVAAPRVREEGVPYTTGPLVAKLAPRAKEIVLQYLKRLEAAGLGGEELIQMEHLLADRSFAQRFSMSRGGPLTEDDEILLIESTWRAISDTLALRGIRP